MSRPRKADSIRRNLISTPIGVATDLLAGRREPSETNLPRTLIRQRMDWAPTVPIGQPVYSRSYIRNVDGNYEQVADRLAVGPRR